MMVVTNMYIIQSLEIQIMVIRSVYVLEVAN